MRHQYVPFTGCQNSTMAIYGRHVLVARQRHSGEFLKPFIDQPLQQQILDVLPATAVSDGNIPEITRATLSRFQDAIQNLTFVRQTAVVHLGAVKNPDTLVQVADFFLKMAKAMGSIASGVYGKRLVVIIRNAGFRRDAGKLARDLFGSMLGLVILLSWNRFSGCLHPRIPLFFAYCRLAAFALPPFRVG